MSLLQCPSVLSTYQSGIPISIVCGYDRQSQPIVCCPKSRKFFQSITRPPHTQTSPQPVASTAKSPPILPKPQRDDPQRYDDQTVHIIDLPEPKPQPQKPQQAFEAKPVRQSQQPLTVEEKPQIQSQYQPFAYKKGQIAKIGITHQWIKMFNNHLASFFFSLRKS